MWRKRSRFRTPEEDKQLEQLSSQPNKSRFQYTTESDSDDDGVQITYEPINKLLLKQTLYANPNKKQSEPSPVTPITPSEKPKKPEFDLFSLRPRIGNSDESPKSALTDTQKDDDFGDFTFDEESSGPSEISPVPRPVRSSQPKRSQTKRLSQRKPQVIREESVKLDHTKSPQKSQQRKPKSVVPSSQNSVVVDLTDSPSKSPPRSKRVRNEEVIQLTPESKPREAQSSVNEEIVKTSQRRNETILEDDIEDPEFNQFFETERESPQKKRKLERSSKKKSKRIDYLDVMDQNQVEEIEEFSQEEPFETTLKHTPKIPITSPQKPSSRTRSEYSPFKRKTAKSYLTGAPPLSHDAFMERLNNAQSDSKSAEPTTPAQQMITPKKFTPRRLFDDNRDLMEEIEEITEDSSHKESQEKSPTEKMDVDQESQDNTTTWQKRLRRSSSYSTPEGKRHKFPILSNQKKRQGQYSNALVRAISGIQSDFSLFNYKRSLLQLKPSSTGDVQNATQSDSQQLSLSQQVDENCLDVIIMLEKEEMTFYVTTCKIRDKEEFVDVIFNQQTKTELDLSIGKCVRLIKPWSEYPPDSDDICGFSRRTILCTYFCEVVKDFQVDQTDFADDTEKLYQHSKRATLSEQAIEPQQTSTPSSSNAHVVTTTTLNMQSPFKTPQTPSRAQKQNIIITPRKLVFDGTMQTTVQGFQEEKLITEIDFEIALKDMLSIPPLDTKYTHVKMTAIVQRSFAHPVSAKEGSPDNDYDYVRTIHKAILLQEEKTKALCMLFVPSREKYWNPLIKGEGYRFTFNHIGISRKNFITTSSPLYSIVKNFYQERSSSYLLYTLRVTPLSTCKITPEHEQLSESQISESQMEQLTKSSLYKGSVSVTVNQLLALKESGQRYSVKADVCYIRCTTYQQVNEPLCILYVQDSESKSTKTYIQVHLTKLRLCEDAVRFLEKSETIFIKDAITAKNSKNNIYLTTDVYTVIQEVPSEKLSSTPSELPLGPLKDPALYDIGYVTDSLKSIIRNDKAPVKSVCPKCLSVLQQQDCEFNMCRRCLQPFAKPTLVIEFDAKLSDNITVNIDADTVAVIVGKQLGPATGKETYEEAEQFLCNRRPKTFLCSCEQIITENQKTNFVYKSLGRTRLEMCLERLKELLTIY